MPTRRADRPFQVVAAPNPRAALVEQPIISVSGLRGIVGVSLTPEIATRYAQAFAAGLAAGPIIITRDSRPSGAMLAEAIAASLIQGGRDVINAGIAATPTTGVLVRQFQAAGGLQISASHNPAQYNGLKLFSGEGRVIPAAAGQAVLDRYLMPEATKPQPITTGSPAQVKICADAIGEHLRLLRGIVDVEAIRQRRFRVLLDANHGAGGLLGGVLLRELGCEVNILGEAPSGQFAHTPEPTAENLASVLPLVREGRFDIGFCQDPDADRLAIIDDAGRYLGEEYTLALVRRARAAQPPGAGRHQLLDQPHDRGPGRQIWRGLFPLGGGRGQRGRCDARPQRGPRRRRERRRDRPARGAGSRQLRGHGLAAGRHAAARLPRSRH